MDNNSKVDGVEALSPFLRSLMKGDPHDLDETVVNNTKKRCLEELKRTNNIESGKAAYWFANGQDYGYKHGITLGHPTGRRACRKTLDQSKRGRIVMFSRESRRHFIAAMETHDLPNGSIKYYIALTALHWGENKWERKDVLDDFDKVRKTFRTSFARCFKRCAIILKSSVEPRLRWFN